MPERDVPPPPPRLPQPRNGNRTQLRSPNNQGDRDAWAAARWVLDGWTLREIADALELKSKSAAHDSVQRGLRTTRAATTAMADEARAAHRARLGYALEVVTEVMGRDHVHFSQGRVMKDDEGDPLIDDAPKLAAAGKLKDLSESLRKLDGLDAPAKLDLTMEAIDAALAAADADIADARRQATEAGGTQGEEG